MAGENLKLIKTYKFRSIFVKILAILLGYSVVFLIVLYFYSRGVIYNTVEQNLQGSVMNILEKTQESVDREFSNILFQMEELARNEHIRAALVAPNIKNSVRNYNIAQQLKFIMQGNPLVNCTLLYIPNDDTVFTSEGSAGMSDDYLLEHVSRQPLFNFLRSGFGKAGDHTLRQIGNELYLALNVPVFFQKSLGILVFQIDQHYLSSIINKNEDLENDATSWIWVFDENATPLLASVKPYPSELYEMELSALKQTENHQKIETMHYFTIVSPNNNWRYLYVVSATPPLLTDQAAYIGLLWCVLLLAVFSMFSSFYITRGMYTPFHRLLNAVEAPPQLQNNAALPYRDELDFLEKRVNQTALQNAELQEFMKHACPAITSQTFRHLILGQEISAEELDQTFATLAVPFHSSQHYLVLLVAISSLNNSLISQVEQNIYLHRITQLSTSFASDQFQCAFVQLLENSRMAIVCAFEEEIDAAQSKCYVEKMLTHLENSMASMPYQLLFGCSWIPTAYTEIPRSFLVARQQLNRTIYLQGRALEQAQPAEADFNQTEKQLMAQMLSDLLEDVLSGKELHGRERFVALMNRLIDDHASTDDLQQLANMVWESAWALLLPLNIPNLEQSLASDQQQLLFCGEGRAESVRKKLLHFCDHLIWILSAYAQKQKHRYVEGAIQYIEEHYENSDLSLSQVAEHLGISQSYLSTVFKKNANINFVDYLNAYRVERSKLLLEMTGMTIEDIGFQTGFSSARNFIRVFKKYSQTSPGQFREEHKKLL